MTLSHSARKMYQRGQPIAVCVVSYQGYMTGDRDTLDIKVNGRWLYDFKPPIKDYPDYQLTMSPLESDLLRFAQRSDKND